MTMNIGGHVSTKGGIEQALDNGMLIGADVIQTHPSSPQTWRQLKLDDGATESFVQKLSASSIKAHYFHAAYLINLATPNNKLLLRQSIASLVQALDLAEQIGASGVIFHPGSHKGQGFTKQLPQIGNALQEVLGKTSSSAKLLVENNAGQGDCVGRNFEEVGAIADTVKDDPRIGVCLDTCHAFASGYDLRDEDSIKTTLKVFEKEIGFDKLQLIHTNDSRAEFNSNVDRHANIGEGFIGDQGFRLMLSETNLRAVPWILETPGGGEGPRLEDINKVRELAGLESRTSALVN